MTNGRRTIVMVVMRAAVALCAGFVVLVAVATFARPEPRPCQDKKGPGLQTLVLIICAASDVEDEQSGWVWCQAASGDQGWVPLRTVAES